MTTMVGDRTTEVAAVASEPDFIAPGPSQDPDPLRAEAKRRVEAKRSFASHLTTYVVVNAFLVMIWFVTGRGYFWPVWILGGWGIGLVLNFWEAFLRRPVTEADVDAELRRIRGR